MRFTREILHTERILKFNKFVFSALRIALLWLILLSIGYFIFVYITHTPKTRKLKAESDVMMSDFKELQQKIADKQVKIDILKDRNNNIYRAVYGLDSMKQLPLNIKQPQEMFAHLKNDRYKSAITQAWFSIDNLSTSVVSSSMALDTIYILAKEQTSRINNIPSIWPINRKYLRSSIGSFGTRIHPILGRVIFHDGVDLPCNQGTKIYATADGRIKEANMGWDGGYGNNIMIDHGYGYMTRYAHMSRIIVVPGQRVKRGEVIGLSGNTGRTSGAHLHYEVLYRRKNVNPMNYFRRSMTDQDFKKVLDMVKETSYEEL
ncbi:MAG: M23 family metallopeptidase [Rikenellaceae bacterium]